MIDVAREHFVARREPPRKMRSTRPGGRRTPVRILHVVSRMYRAGIQAWLMHVLRHTDRAECQMDFLVHSEKPGDFDQEIESLESKLLYAPALRQFWRYEKLTANVLRTVPPYDIIHSHLDYFSGYPLKCASRAGIPVRIAHSHSDLARSHSRLRWPLRLYASRSQSLISRYATHGLAASDVAGEALFGKTKSRLPWRVLPCGVDLAAFSPRPGHDDVRREFGIPDHAVVIGHVGRFVREKNHELIVHVAEALFQRSCRSHLVLVGDGPLRTNVEENINRRGFRGQVTFAGVRADVPRLFTSLFDVLLFPSQFEGLGLAVIESLAAGCPAVISDVVPPEADVVPSLVTRISLSSSPEQWADAVLLAANQRPSSEERAAAWEAVCHSPFNISACVEELTDFYLREHSRERAA